ncbi:MAG: aminotransferase class V-fold PLP-dependent enzyme [Fidelibacterota bacterium]|nr:MAG: aminotransferase class V-fold PLP-dependent enzyme [Candidatus Neomarinimicrobiota bacterium]
MNDHRADMEETTLRGEELFRRVAGDFIGLDTTYPVASGQTTRRIYLDSTASTLMMGAAHRAITAFLEHYANTHSLLHNSAWLATRAYAWAHERILRFVHADPEQYTCFFTGSGTTAGVNRMARVFRDLQPERDTVLVSIMEHHSNDLPHRKHLGRVIHLPVAIHKDGMGCVDTKALEKLLEREQKRVNYVAITGVSNVTGIINPIGEIARLAHKHGALVLVDAAQMVAHIPVQVSGHTDAAKDVDALIFSGHKTYVPGSPGVVIARKEHLSQLEPEEVGGGMVERVFTERYTVSPKFPDREEAGTPNIPGAIGLAVAIEVLDRIGMDFLVEEENRIINYALDGLKSIPEVEVYGSTDTIACPRAASISFNVEGVHHSLVAAVLNDYHNIAVRNECFCAHPYVIEMIPDQAAEYIAMSDEDLAASGLPKPGMVRASFGLYSTRADADALVKAIKDIILNKDTYLPLYQLAETDHEFRHVTFSLDPASYSIPNLVDNALEIGEQ